MTEASDVGHRKMKCCQEAKLELLLFSCTFHQYCVQTWNVKWLLPTPEPALAISLSTREFLSYMIKWLQAFGKMSGGCPTHIVEFWIMLCCRNQSNSNHRLCSPGWHLQHTPFLPSSTDVHNSNENDGKQHVVATQSPPWIWFLLTGLEIVLYLLAP